MPVGAGEVDVDDQDRPTDPPLILSTEVLWNPFEDIVPRLVPSSVAPAAPKAPAKKAVVAKNLLSFDDDEEGEQEAAAAAPKAVKIKSAHDVLADPRYAPQASPSLPASTSPPFAQPPSAAAASRGTRITITTSSTGTDKFDVDYMHATATICVNNCF